MKKYLFLAALGLVTLASCTSDDLVVQGPAEAFENGGAIVFSPQNKAITRADFTGSDAATKLGNKFVVYGVKHAAAEDKTADNDAVVYNNFQVQYAANTAGTTASNSSDWEYVGLQAYDATPTKQGIKYWDYDADGGYTFYAFSSSDISYPKAAATDKVQVTKTTSDGTSLYNKGYSVTVNTDANLDNLYFADRKPIAKGNYDKTVSLTFRNLGTKVRVGFYETIPGYTVQIDKFYIDEDASAVVTDFAEMKDAQTDGFYASLQNVKKSANQTLNVTYYDNTDAAIENRPRVTNPSAGYDYALKLGAGVIGTELGTSAVSPTWDNSGNYTTVFPFDGNTNPLLLKLDFTMTSDDGTNDVIKVRGARAIVPAEYVKWKSNFSYTYLFKISDKTNGTTGDVDSNGDPITDPEGLKPITFDAVVVDVADELQETITSIATNSITTYAEGAIVDEYHVGKPVYIAVENNATHAVITPSAIGTAAGNAQVYKIDKATTEASVLAKLTGSPIDITMTALTTPAATIETTVPFADGTNPAIANVKFAPSSTGYYAYVYTTTAYVAPTYTVQSSGTYDSSNTYYMLSGSGAYYAVSVSNAATFNDYKSQLYLQTNPGTPGVYDVKVIKVQ